MTRTHYLFIALCLVLLAPAHAQTSTDTTDTANTIQRTLRSFDRVVASPKINVILQKGTDESIRVVYQHVEAHQINIEVRNHTLRIYLDNARVTDKLERVGRHNRRSAYADAQVTAYITYRELEHLEIRGNQELTCNSPIVAETFTLKAYGENEINLTSLRTEYLRASLYGENKLRIRGGKADFQKYRLFGANKIDTQHMKSYAAITHIFGESKLRLSTQDQLKVNSFGESEVSYLGEASVSKGLIFGRTNIHRLN